MNNIIIREMLPEEENVVYQIGKRAFNGFERLWVAKPKLALVALIDDKIVGAVLYKVFNDQEDKIGYIDYAFIDPNYHGQGIGKLLYKSTFEFLWEKDCTSLTSIVKDSNVGSWTLFLQNGFVRVSLMELIRCYGFLGALKHYFATPLCFSLGMEYYVATNKTKNDQVVSKTSDSTKQILAYLFANTFLVTASAIKAQSATSFFIAYLTMLIFCVGTQYLGTRFSAQRIWSFRLNNGGIFVSALVNLICVFPLVGNWYPQSYEKSKRFDRDLGITALVEWASLLIITVLCSQNPNAFLALLSYIGVYLLAYKVFLIYPFESFGGTRVFKWNKVIYAIMSLLSILTIFYKCSLF